jgi:hypothetical protein
VEILNLGGAAESNTPAPKSRKKLRVILGIGALAAVTGLGSTLAANISLNGGGNVEFGQGVATTAACDDDITLTPVSTFSNSYEDATFAMTAIQISGIDLTPEGWDRSANLGTGAWHVGFNPTSWDDLEGVYIDGSWDPEYEQYAGQYYNGTDWVNTCSDKSLMLRAYTDNTNYAERTAGNNISSPLLLNGNFSQRPIYGVGGGFNAGVGFRFQTVGDGPDDADYIIWEMADDITWDGDLDMGSVNVSEGGEYLWEDSTVTISINEDSGYPSLDSRWVDKLTIESAASMPSGWIEDTL